MECFKISTSTACRYYRAYQGELEFLDDNGWVESNFEDIESALADFTSKHYKISKLTAEEYKSLLIINELEK